MYSAASCFRPDYIVKLDKLVDQDLSVSIQVMMESKPSSVFKLMRLGKMSCRKVFGIPPSQSLFPSSEKCIANMFYLIIFCLCS